MTEPKMTLEEAIAFREELLSRYGESYEEEAAWGTIPGGMIRVCNQLIESLGPEPEWKEVAAGAFDEALESGVDPPTLSDEEMRAKTEAQSERWRASAERQERGALPFRGEA